MATRLLAERAGTPDPKGRWCVWWGTVGDDSHVVNRYTDEDAATAATALANQKLSEVHTGHLLCGHEVRRLVDGAWRPTDTSEDDAGARS